MEQFYNEALNKIKKLNRVPSAKEWDKIAKEEGYLTTIALVYISGKNFYKLCSETRK